MRTIKLISSVAIIALLAACSSKFKSYNGPEVTRILVYKESRKMYLLHENKVLESYPIELGFAPAGDKTIEGDGRTPEGNYTIDRRNPESSYHLSLGISYPSRSDVAKARALGKPPGGDIFIHGARRIGSPKRADWTEGCISVSNREIEQIYSMVKNETLISIYE